MIPMDVLSRYNFKTVVDTNGLFSDPLVARLRAAGFIKRKGHWSAQAYKRWKKHFERRARFFATEEGKAQAVCAIAEALLSK